MRVEKCELDRQFNKVFNPNLISRYIELGEMLNDLNKNRLTKSIEDCKKRVSICEERIKICEKWFSNMMKNKDMVKSIFDFTKRTNEDMYRKIFDIYVLTPWVIMGNKHHPNFDEIYEFLSSFDGSSFTKGYPTDEITLFRVMDVNEYKRLKRCCGVKSPSFSTNPLFIGRGMISYNLYLDPTIKNVLVMVKIKLEDVIGCVGDTDEYEVLVKKGSQPTLVKKVCDYTLDDLIERYSDEILNFLPLTSQEVSNGFTIEDTLIMKGYSYQQNENISKYMVSLIEGLIDVLKQYGNMREPHIRYIFNYLIGLNGNYEPNTNQVEQLNEYRMVG